jgi:hypothetical protein
MSATPGRPLSDMRLGEAIAELHRGAVACACIGGAWCCIRRAEQARALQRGAHIVARLLDDHTRR